MNQQIVKYCQPEANLSFFQMKPLIKTKSFLKVLGSVLVTGTLMCFAHAQKPVLHLPMDKEKIMSVSNGGVLTKKGTPVFGGIFKKKPHRVCRNRFDA